MPIVSSLANASILGFGAFSKGNFESIATVTVGSGGASSISFSDIPGTYQHLQLRGLLKGSATNGGTPRIQFNSSGDFAYHHITGDGATASAYGYSAADGNYFGLGAQKTGNYTAFICDMLDYVSTSKNKTVRTFMGVDENGSGSVWITSNYWRSTAAITAISFTLQTANFAQYSTFALYGLRAP